MFWGESGGNSVLAPGEPTGASDSAPPFKADWKRFKLRLDFVFENASILQFQACFQPNKFQTVSNGSLCTRYNQQSQQISKKHICVWFVPPRNGTLTLTLGMGMGGGDHLGPQIPKYIKQNSYENCSHFWETVRFFFRKGWTTSFKCVPIYRKIQRIRTQYSI